MVEGGKLHSHRPIKVHWTHSASPITKIGEAGDRFSEYLCVDYANLPCTSGHNQFTNTTFTRPFTQISKSSNFAAKIEPSLRMLLSVHSISLICTLTLALAPRLRRGESMTWAPVCVFSSENGLQITRLRKLPAKFGGQTIPCVIVIN